MTSTEYNKAVDDITIEINVSVTLEADNNILYLVPETSDFTDLIASQMELERPSILTPINGAAFGENFILSYKITTYNIVPADDLTT